MLNYHRVTYNELGHPGDLQQPGRLWPREERPPAAALPRRGAPARPCRGRGAPVGSRIPGKGRRRWRWRTKMVISPRKKDETWIKTMVFDMMNI